MEDDGPIQAMWDAAGELRHAQRMRERKMKESTKRLHDAIRKADALGMPKTEIATYAGVSRQTVYDILAETD